MFSPLLHYLDQLGWHYEAYLSVCLPPSHLRRGIKPTVTGNFHNGLLFSKKWNTRLSPEQRGTEDIALYNLDEFHTIRQVRTEVKATRAGEKPTLIAHCKTVEAAQYVIKNILEK